MALFKRNAEKTVDTSQAVGVFDKLVGDIVNFVENLFAKKQLTVDEFASSSSKEIDRIILKKMNEGNEFIAGRFKLNYLNDETFNFSFDIYLKHPKATDYMRINGNSKIISMTRLKPEAFQELKLKKEIAFEIEEPQTDAYAQIENQNEDEPSTDSVTSIKL